jgi:hypothetical protein
MWEKLPYRLDGDARNWDIARNEHGGALLGLWKKHAPNLGDAVIDSFTRSPRFHRRGSLSPGRPALTHLTNEKPA